MSSDISAAWRKSTYSNGSGSCVEAGSAAGLVLVRDTKLNEHGPVLRLTAADWTRLVKSVKG